ncbi:SRPBCC domain-containing protein [Aeromonas sp. sif2433]|uniref:SRPBCC family protein n=1 Tax=Aeromonas sp. sif2433 TaxID=2854794 RepID=UPI001C475247|nr:SRPBCC domain-containing protein [Aeromonas sp. sif2433]MBV7413882.1 SRPBCC domain-containing protein [Aeromonas sp. sif2433]
MDNKQIEGSILVPAHIDDVWRAWTTESGLRSFLAPECLMVPEPNGPFEIYFRPDAPLGERGSEGCRVMAVMPHDLLSFSWNFPSQFPHIRQQKTLVSLRFVPEGQGTRLHFLQTGWTNDPDWDLGYDYFREEWLEINLPRLQYRFTHGPIDWNCPPNKQQLKSLAQ